MTMMASQMTSLTVVYSTVYSDADQRKHQSSTSLAFVWGFTRTGEFPAQRASYVENVSMWLTHHENCKFWCKLHWILFITVQLVIRVLVLITGQIFVIGIHLHWYLPITKGCLCGCWYCFVLCRSSCWTNRSCQWFVIPLCLGNIIVMQHQMIMQSNQQLHLFYWHELPAWIC